MSVITSKHLKCTKCAGLTLRSNIEGRAAFCLACGAWFPIAERQSVRQGGVIAKGENRDDWKTPDYIYGPLNEEFRFKIDLTASPMNTLCRHYFTKEQDVLQQDWAQFRVSCWCNPPYDHKTLTAVISRARMACRAGAGPFVFLVPANKTEQGWWHDHVVKVAEVRWIRGRVKYQHGEGLKTWAAPFPSCIIIFRPLQMSHPSPEYPEGFINNAKYFQDL